MDVRRERFDDLSDDEKQLIREVHVGAGTSQKEYEAALLAPKGISSAAMDKAAAANSEPSQEINRVEKYYELLVKRRNDVAEAEGIRESENWSFIAITDHNVCDFACRLSQHAWENNRLRQNRLVILPGIELDISFPVPEVDDTIRAHILCIFSPSAESRHIYGSIREASGQGKETSWDFGQSNLEVDSLPRFVSNMREQGSICIAAHIGSSKGIHCETAESMRRCVLSPLDAEIARISQELSMSAPTGVPSEELPTGSRAELEQELGRLEEEYKERARSDAIHLPVLKLIGECGFDALQVTKRKDERYYRRLHRFKSGLGRAVPIVCSDAHKVGNIFSCETALEVTKEEDRTPADDSHTITPLIPYLKLSGLSTRITPDYLLEQIKNRGLYFGETRFAFSTPGRVSMWIEGIEVTREASSGASSFWRIDNQRREYEGSNRSIESKALQSSQDKEDEEFIIPLSPNLNCLIGGRGSGKSAILETVKFIIQGGEFNSEKQKREDEIKDWYKRTEATLNGCRARLVWRDTTLNSVRYPKRVLFASRYFNPSGNHPDPRYTSLDDDEILGESPVLPIQIYRIHEIEEHADDSEKIRSLFDDICGERIVELNSDINILQQTLLQQRIHRMPSETNTIPDDLIDVVKGINTLTKDESPLREYVERKRRYDEVNSPTNRTKYEKIDAIGEIQRICIQAISQWTGITDSIDLDRARQKIVGFFQTFRNSLKLGNDPSTDGNDVDSNSAEDKSEENPYAQILNKALVSEVDQISPVEKILAALKILQEEWGSFGDLLTQINNEIEDVLMKAQADLGQPVGSEDRELKKQDWKEAEDDLEIYRQLVTKYKSLISHRQKLFEDLVDKCKNRTELRSHTAEQVTRKLSRDLDPRILVVLAEARGMADRKAFDAWLNENFMGGFSRYRQKRLEKLTEKKLMPQQLRALLLGEDRAALSNLIVDASANEGGINDSNAQTAVDHLSAQIILESEINKDEVDESAWKGLPIEIREGLLHFPEFEDGHLKLETVLELDEIVLDDIPVIRMKDRLEMKEPRPLDELSPGQRCSAVLPILLLTNNCPLIIDQPEDNLDNRLIRQVIINVLNSVKLHRQVIVATHNPNLPVLGDAEQVLALRAIEEHEACMDDCGSLENDAIVKHITSIMEGGREAFQYRHSIYIPLWKEPVENPDEAI